MYPPAVQEKIDALKSYKEDPNLKAFDILHMYPKEIAFPDGYHEARFSEVILFDIATKRKKVINQKVDGISIGTKCHVDFVEIYADGSTVLKFRSRVGFIQGQLLFITDLG